MMGGNDTIKQLDHILNFQLSDLRKGLILATANFLVAIGCMNTIEFLGGVRNGKLGQNGTVNCRFKEGVALLGGEYTTFGKDNMYKLRNGLTHQYLPSLKGLKHIVVANDWNSGRAITLDGDELTLNVAKLVIDLGGAWGHLRCELLSDSKKLHDVGVALQTLPRLL